MWRLRVRGLCGSRWPELAEDNIQQGKDVISYPEEA